VRRGRTRVKDLAAEAGIDLDEALVSLWEAKIDVDDENSYVFQRDVRQARSALGLEDDRRVSTVDYWLEKSGVSREDLTERLARVGSVLQPDARRIPKNSLRRLRSLFPEVSGAEVSTPSSPIEVPSSPLNWEIVGSGSYPVNLTEEDIRGIHEVLVEDFRESGDPIEPPGIRSVELLSSAASRPLTSLGEERKYPTPQMAGAALFHSAVHNHAFFNGNKRTALVSLIVFLDRNGLVLTCSQQELFRKTLTLAQHGLVDSRLDQLADREVMDLARWIKSNSRAIQRGEKIMKWHRLKARLREFGCEFEMAPSVGNRINVKRVVTRKRFFGRLKEEPLHVQVAYSGDGSEADKGVIHYIRTKLELDDAHDVDSARFYDGAEVDDWIAEYRRVLLRLARV
jgi:death-on-curing family protein